MYTPLPARLLQACGTHPRAESHSYSTNILFQPGSLPPKIVIRRIRRRRILPYIRLIHPTHLVNATQTLPPLPTDDLPLPEHHPKSTRTTGELSISNAGGPRKLAAKCHGDWLTQPTVISLPILPQVGGRAVTAVHAYLVAPSLSKLGTVDYRGELLRTTVQYSAPESCSTFSQVVSKVSLPSTDLSLTARWP